MSETLGQTYVIVEHSHCRTFHEFQQAALYYLQWGRTLPSESEWCHDCGYVIIGARCGLCGDVRMAAREEIAEWLTGVLFAAPRSKRELSRMARRFARGQSCRKRDVMRIAQELDFLTSEGSFRLPADHPWVMQ